MLANVAGKEGPPVGDHQEGAGPVVRLAGALVGRVKGIAGGAAAVVALAALAPLGVGAGLTTDARGVALISVHTGLGVIQTHAPGAGAQGPSGSLDTPVTAAGLGAATVVQVAVIALICAIGTVGLAVADTGHGDADARGGGVGTSPGAVSASQLCGVTGVLFLVLVTSVAAVVLAVTDEGPEHTLVVVALEVVAGAGNGAAGVGLVAPVLAVWRPVTIPQLGHTDAALLALELGLGVALIGSEHGTSLLITAVITVRDTVTLVRLVDALLQVAALELAGGAGYRRTALLVRVVKAVVVAVTPPGLGDAGAAVAAGELEVLAGLDAAALALVSRVSAVVLSVTFPRQRNTPAVATLELGGLARYVLTASLV